MNKAQIQKNLGWEVRLRPQATGENVSGRDDFWVIKGVDDDALELVNVRTGHQAILGLDAVITFMTDPAGGPKRDFLQLGAQVRTNNAGPAELEPVPLQRGASTVPLRDLRIELRKASSDAKLELVELPKFIKSVLRSRIAVSAAIGTVRSGGMAVFKEQCAKDEAEAKNLREVVLAENHDFAAMSDAEVENGLLDVHRALSRAKQLRRHYERELALDDKERDEIRKRHSAKLSG